LLTDEKFFADFLVAEALSDELHNFFLAVAEKWLFAARARLGRFREGLHDLGGHAVIEPDFAGVDTLNAFDEKIGCGLLENNAASAEAHGANDITIVFGSGETRAGSVSKLTSSRTARPSLSGMRRSAKGFRRAAGVSALRAVLGFADDSDVFVGIEEFAEAVAKDRVVVR
jgi:hypothetical protein